MYDGSDRRAFYAGTKVEFYALGDDLGKIYCCIWYLLVCNTVILEKPLELSIIMARFLSVRIAREKGRGASLDT